MMTLVSLSAYGECGYLSLNVPVGYSIMSIHNTHISTSESYNLSFSKSTRTSLYYSFVRKTNRTVKLQLQ